MSYSFDGAFSSFGMFAALGTTFTIICTIISIAMCILYCICYWRLFTIADKPGWASLIPLYNVWVMFEIVYGKGVKCLLLLVPFLNIAVGIAFCIRLCQAYGKSTGMGVLMLFFPYVATPILAFSKDTTYVGAVYSFI